VRLKRPERPDGPPGRGNGHAGRVRQGAPDGGKRLPASLEHEGRQSCPDFTTPDYTSCQGSTGPTGVVEKQKPPVFPGVLTSACIKSPLLYRLSYASKLVYS